MRRDGGRRRRSGAAGAPALATALEHRGLAGRDPPRVGRCRAGAGRRVSMCVTFAASSNVRSSEAGIDWSTLDAIAVTQGPGLIGSLLVGVSFAKSAAWAAGKPLVAVNHLAGHIESLWLENGEIPTPAVVLVVSGGHTSLYLVDAARDVSADWAHPRRCGGRGVTTRLRNCSAWDIPAGRLSIVSPSRETQTAVSLPGTRLTHPDRNAPSREYRFDFSFSGLKTAVLRHVRDRQARARRRAACPRPTCVTSRRAFRRRSWKPWSSARLPRRSGTTRARLASPAASRRTRACAQRARARGDRAGLPVFLPSTHLSTDNAAMIAAAGLRKIAAGEFAPADLNAAATLPL